MNLGRLAPIFGEIFHLRRKKHGISTATCFKSLRPNARNRCDRASKTSSKFYLQQNSEHQPNRPNLSFCFSRLSVGRCVCVMPYKRTPEDELKKRNLLLALSTLAIGCASGNQNTVVGQHAKVDPHPVNASAIVDDFYAAARLQDAFRAEESESSVVITTPISLAQRFDREIPSLAIRLGRLADLKIKNRDALRQTQQLCEEAADRKDSTLAKQCINNASDQIRVAASNMALSFSSCDKANVKAAFHWIDYVSILRDEQESMRQELEEDRLTIETNLQAIAQAEHVEPNSKGEEFAKTGSIDAERREWLIEKLATIRAFKLEKEVENAEQNELVGNNVKSGKDANQKGENISPTQDEFADLSERELAAKLEESAQNYLLGKQEELSTEEAELNQAVLVMNALLELDHNKADQLLQTYGDCESACTQVQLAHATCDMTAGSTITKDVAFNAKNAQIEGAKADAANALATPSENENTSVVVEKPAK